jgi:hypothetical protein
VQEEAVPLQRQGETLPNELLSRIVSLLQSKRQYHTLAEFARANRNFYDIAIPKLYETIIVTERNEPLLRYGHYAGRDSEGKVLVASSTVRLAGWRGADVSDGNSDPNVEDADRGQRSASQHFRRLDLWETHERWDRDLE